MVEIQQLGRAGPVGYYITAIVAYLYCSIFEHIIMKTKFNSRKTEETIFYLMKTNCLNYSQKCTNMMNRNFLN